MASDDHSVNMARRYHHGDLRAAAIRAGLELIASSRSEDLSLREVARTVGVSANALYRHFPDKNALLSALASEGLDRLAQAQRAAAAAADGKRRGFAATGKAYVRFAQENPALFRLIFAQPTQGLDADNEPAALLRENVAASAGEAADERIAAARAWALAHGLAMLMLDGQLTLSDEMLDEVFARHL